MPKKIMLLFFIAVCFSCKVTWVPDYNAKLEDQITKTAKANDKLYIDMLDDGPDKRTYGHYKEKYNDIEADINSIYLFNEARSNNNDLLVITSNLKNAFQEAKKYHKDNDKLSDGEIKAYQATMAGFWKPLYLAERGLKINANKN
ncbi:MAG TPA: hypothetical protein VK166_08240 [Chitinophagaceae bacterium]|nr:hypothetical protein [Chitinophagaceae bacterium]